MEHVRREFLTFPLLFILIDDPSESNPVLDLRFWVLLHSILLSLSFKNSKTGLARNAWLIPLLNRVPLLPIVMSLLSNSLNLPAQKRDEVYLQSSRSLALVWSLAAPKFSLDNLLECFGSVLRVLEGEAAGSVQNPGLVAICTLVPSSLRTALSHSSNKKKVCHMLRRFFDFMLSLMLVHSLVKPLSQTTLDHGSTSFPMKGVFARVHTRKYLTWEPSCFSMPTASSK